MQLLSTMAFVIRWLLTSRTVLDIKHIVLFKADNVEIFIDFYFDRITAVFAVIGAILAYLLAIFSRYYLHRDEDFKRYFSTILLFFLGYNLVIYSGNF